MLEAVRDEAGELGCEVCCPRAGREAHGATPPLEATCEQHETAEPCLSEAFRLWARAAVVFSLPVADVGDTSARFHASSVCTTTVTATLFPAKADLSPEASTLLQTTELMQSPTITCPSA